MTSFDWTMKDNRCFGCGDNPWGLDLCFEKDGEWLVATTRLHHNYQGFKHSAHGGIIATLLDEAAAWAVMTKTGRIAPSFELNCNFLKPVPLEDEIAARAKVVKQSHGVAESKAEILQQPGATLATAEVRSKVLDKEIRTG